MVDWFMNGQSIYHISYHIIYRMTVIISCDIMYNIESVLVINYRHVLFLRATSVVASNDYFKPSPLAK